MSHDPVTVRFDDIVIAEPAVKVTTTRFILTIADYQMRAVIESNDTATDFQVRISDGTDTASRDRRTDIGTIDEAMTVAKDLLRARYIAEQIDRAVRAQVDQRIADLTFDVQAPR